MKAPALLLAAALACGGAAFAAEPHDPGSAGSAKAGAHALASDFRQALHKLGAATRHALRRADAAIHRNGDHGT